MRKITLKKKTIKLIRFIFYRGTTLILDINNVYLCTVCYSLEIGYKVNIFWYSINICTTSNADKLTLFIMNSLILISNFPNSMVSSFNQIWFAL